MSQPHVIRLNRAWELRALNELPAGATAIDEIITKPAIAARIDLPAMAKPREFTGGAGLLLTRRFNRPSNLSPGQPVFLRVSPLVIGETAYLNGEELAPANKHDAQADAALHAISGRIRENNRLDIVASDAERIAGADIRLIIYEIPLT